MPADGTELPTTAADAIERVFVRVFTALAAMSWIGMVLAELGWFRPIPLAALAILGMVVGGLSLEGALRRQASRALRPVELLCVLVLGSLAGAVVLPPGDPVVGGADESVYLSIASHLRHHGALVTEDTLLAETPQEDWPRLFSRDRFWPQRLNRFDGGVQIVEGAPVLQPSFFHLLPAWIAGTELFASERAGRLVAPVFAVLSAIVLYLAARRLTSLVAAAAAGALLATSLGQAWCGRLPLSELPAQFFVLSGVWLTAWWADTDSAVPGVLAGVAFGLAALSRVDVLILVIPAVVVVLGVRWWQRGADRALVGYALALAVVSANAAAHALTIAQPYTLRIGRHLVHDRTLPALLAGAAALAFLGALLAVAQRRRWRISALGRYLGLAIAVATIGIVVHQPDRLIESPLAYLLTPVGLALAGVGLLRWSRRDDAAAWVVVLLAAASALAYLDRARDLPEMPGVFRRTLPVLLPLAGLLLADTLAPRRARRLWTIAGAIVLAGLIASGARHVGPILGQRIASGGRDAIHAIARNVPASAVLIVDRSLPSHLALAVDFIFSRSAVAADFALARSPERGPAALTRLMTRAARGAHEVLLLTAAEDPRAPWLPGVLPAGWTPYASTGCCPRL